MRKFSEFNIVVEHSSFTGDKIKMSKILNRSIVVHGYKIEDSKQNTGKCLYLQIEMSGVKHVVFTGSTKLQESIRQVPADGFPFETTIVEENEMYLFT